jgi:hypothetical protein
MKIDNIGEGQIIKNHRVLCEVLEIPFKNNTGSKNSQRNELARYCKFERKGQSYIIKEIYDTPLSKVENRGKSEGSRRNKGIYGKLIQTTILDYLISTKRLNTTITRNRLLESIGMVNVNFVFGSTNVPKISSFTNIHEKVVYDFYNLTRDNFLKKIDDELANLQKKSIITYRKVTIVNSDSYMREADDVELAIISECSDMVLEEMGFKEMQHVRISPKWSKFRDRVNKEVSGISDIKFFFLAYKIELNNEYINNETNLKENRNILNLEVLDRMKKSAQSRHENGFNSEKMGRYRLKKDYVDNIKKLSELLIDSKTYNLEHEVKEHYQQVEKERLEDIEVVESLDELLG